MGAHARCIFCGALAVVDCSRQHGLRTVSSDCKPRASHLRLGSCGQCGYVQSIVDDEWRADAASIYGEYQSYYQTSDRDQTTYVTGRPESRTMLFLRHVLAHAAPATGARVLDYGCGSGNVLRGFSAARDDLTLHGFDLDDRESSSLKRIRGFRDLYVGTLPEGSQFDIIVMSHSLEHLDDPVGSLEGIVGHLAPGGHLAVAVPDCELDAYKLLIADHCSHFSAVNLKTLLAAAGLHLGSIPTHVHSRELWAVAVAGAAAPTHGAGSFGDEWLAPSLVWLARVRDQARRLTAKGDVAVFGTSVSGMWMFAELGDAVCAFVDEDEARSGRLVHGRPILHPRDLPTSTRVLVPLPPPQGASIVRRLSPRGGEWHTLGDVVHPT